jgi:hypothetical protein
MSKEILDLTEDLDGHVVAFRSRKFVMVGGVDIYDIGLLKFEKEVLPGFLRKSLWQRAQLWFAPNIKTGLEWVFDYKSFDLRVLNDVDAIIWRIEHNL